MESEIKSLSIQEQEEIVGGTNWSCFSSGGLIVGGLLTGQLEFVGYGIFGVATTC